MSFHFLNLFFSLVALVLLTFALQCFEYDWHQFWWSVAVNRKSNLHSLSVSWIPWPVGVLYMSISQYPTDNVLAPILNWCANLHVTVRQPRPHRFLVLPLKELGFLVTVVSSGKYWKGGEECRKDAFEGSSLDMHFKQNHLFREEITGITQFITIPQPKWKLEQLWIYQLALFLYPCLTLCIVVTPSHSHLLFYGNNPFRFTPFIWIPVCYLLFC